MSLINSLVSDPLTGTSRLTDLNPHTHDHIRPHSTSFATPSTNPSQANIILPSRNSISTIASGRHPGLGLVASLNPGSSPAHSPGVTVYSVAHAASHTSTGGSTVTAPTRSATTGSGLGNINSSTGTGSPQAQVIAAAQSHRPPNPRPTSGLLTNTGDFEAAAGATRGRNNLNANHDGQDLRDGIDPGDPLTAKGRIKKRPRDKESFDIDDPDRYRYKAYHIRRAFDLYGHIPTIMNEGIKRRAKELTGDSDARNIQSDRDHETFRLIVAHLDGLNDDFVRLKRNPKAFRLLIRKIREAADQARNNDTANLKKDIACMLTPDGSSVLTVLMKGKKASSKLDRGFDNDIMGRYLCPISLDWEDPIVRREIRDGKHAILASDWPRLLYADCWCDPDDLEKGLGRNMALVRVIKYLFTGRSAAFLEAAGGKTTRSGNAALAGMREITPRVVAYGACMLRYAISNEESWSTMDKEFNFEEFYWNVVDIFDDSEDFGKELLGWWNLKVFGTSLETSLQIEVELPPASNSLLKAQRLAKRAAKTALHDSTNIVYSQDNPFQSAGLTQSPCLTDVPNRSAASNLPAAASSSIQHHALEDYSVQTFHEDSQTLAANSYYPDQRHPHMVYPTASTQQHSDYTQSESSRPDSSSFSGFQEQSRSLQLPTTDNTPQDHQDHDAASANSQPTDSSLHHHYTQTRPPPARPHSSSLEALAQVCSAP